MIKHQETTLEAIVANAVDRVVGAVTPGNAADVAKVMIALDLNEAQAELAIETAKEVFSVAKIGN